MRSRTASQQQQASMHGPNPMVRSEPQKALATLDRGPPSSIGRAHSRLPCALAPHPTCLRVRACGRADDACQLRRRRHVDRRATRGTVVVQFAVTFLFFVFFFAAAKQATIDTAGAPPGTEMEARARTAGGHGRRTTPAIHRPSLLFMHADR